MRMERAGGTLRGLLEVKSTWLWTLIREGKGLRWNPIEDERQG
jgi:hypothetical protein